MKRIGKGLSSDDEDDDYLVSVNVVRSGKKYIVRNSVRKDMSELGRYNNLNEALSSLGNPVLDASRSSPRSGERNAKGSDELWCTRCIDDINSLYCCFCGCVYCFGKHDREKLLLCDGCDVENHIYCLDPPLAAIPSGSWYCKMCVINSRDIESLDHDKGIKEHKVKKDTASSKKPTPPAAAKRTPKSSDNNKSKQRPIPESTPASSGFSPHIPATPMSWESRSAPTKLIEKPPPALSDILSLSKGLEMIREHTLKCALLSGDDKEYLERLRDWLPLSDLEVLLDALKSTRNDLESLMEIPSS